MDGYGQAAAVNMVGRIKELLEKLRIKDTHKEIEARIIIRYQSKQRRFFSPIEARSSSSVEVSAAKLSRLNFSNLAARVI